MVTNVLVICGGNGLSFGFCCAHLSVNRLVIESIKNIPCLTPGARRETVAITGSVWMYAVQSNSDVILEVDSDTPCTQWTYLTYILSA